MVDSMKCTKFLLENKIFYVYADVRRKNFEILYTRTLKSLIKIIFLQYLGYKILIPLDYRYFNIFPMCNYVYELPGDKYALYYDTKRLYSLKSGSNTNECDVIDVKISRTRTIDDMHSRLDYSLFEKYIKNVHMVTNMEVIQPFVNSVLQECSRTIHEVGVSECFKKFYHPDTEHVINYILILKYLEYSIPK